MNKIGSEHPNEVSDEGHDDGPLTEKEKKQIKENQKNGMS